MNDEVEALVDKARRSLRSARLLLEDGDPDAAASRCYYAMFYCAEALLLDHGYSFSTHKGVLTGFARHLVKEGGMPEDLHAWLREAFDKRLLADYEVQSPLAPDEVEDLIDHAERFIDETQGHLQGRS